MLIFKKTCDSFSLFYSVVNEKIVKMHSDCLYIFHCGISVFMKTGINCRKKFTPEIEIFQGMFHTDHQLYMK